MHLHRAVPEVEAAHLDRGDLGAGRLAAHLGPLLLHFGDDGTEVATDEARPRAMTMAPARTGNGTTTVRAKRSL